MSLRYTSIYCGADGVSHFKDCEITLCQAVIGPLIPPLGTSLPEPASACYFLTFPPGIHIDWHPAPRRLYHFFLAGECEVQVEDGSVRVFRTGDVVLADDTTGKGHTTRNPGMTVTIMAVVAIPDEQQ